MKKTILTIIAVLFTACKAPKTAFFLIQQYGDEALSRYIIQEFVVANPPKDTVELLKAVEIYNLGTIPVENLKAGKSYSRNFYRETKQLTRNFKKGEPYDHVGLWGMFKLLTEGQQIYNHSGSYLLSTRHHGSEDYLWAYSYLTKENRDMGRNTNRYITERVGSLDEYFINRDK